MTYSTKNKYTQRQWDRTVGWGKVPTEYELMEIIYVDKKDILCERDHPRVYYTLKDGEAICGYCNVKYVHKDKINSEQIKNNLISEDLKKG